jgi:transcriptional regulator with XRE-family HTH domain
MRSGGLPRFRRPALECGPGSSYHPHVTFRAVLQAEFERRRATNPRYSLRAFAQFLGTDHATLSQVLRGKRRVTARSVRTLGRKLRLAAAVIAEHCSIEHETALAALVQQPGFRADSRWIAITAGIPLDEVNVTLQRLLRKRKLVMEGRAWAIR